MNFNYKKLSLFVIGCMSSCLIACGGGGGSSSDPAPEVDLNTYEPSVQMPAEVQSPATPMASVTQKEGVVTLAWLNFDADNKTKLAELNLHIWDGAGCQTIASSFTKNEGWDDTSVTPTRIDGYGAYWDIDVDSITRDPLCVIIRDKTTAKLTGSDEKFEIRHFAAATTAADDTNSGYILLSDIYSSDKYQVPADKTIKDVFTQEYKGPKSPLSIDGASAWWVDKDTFVVFPEKSEFAKLRLYLPKKDADLVKSEKDGKILGTFINLEESTLTPEIEQKLPIVTVKDDKDEAKYKAKVFKVPAEADFDAETEGKQEFSSANLKKEAALLGLAKDGKVTYQSRIKNALLLDNMYAEKASQLEYGAIVDKSGTTFRVWAPTAQDVSVVLFEKDKTQKQVLPMTPDLETGAWSVSSADAKHGTIYKYRIKMYHPYDRKVTERDVTDPYSYGLTTDSTHSIVVDFAQLHQPTNGPHSQATPQDIANMTIIESHIRDMTVYDNGLKDEVKGKYVALSNEDSQAFKHLKELADNGATHLELIPIYDIASIKENREASKYLADLSMSGEDFCKKRDIGKGDTYAKEGLCEATTLQAFVEELAKKDLAAEPKNLGQKDKNAGMDKLEPGSTLVSGFLEYIKNDDSFNWGYDPFHYGAPEGSYATNSDGLTRNDELIDMINSLHEKIGLNVIMDVVYNHTDGASHDETSVLDEVVPWYYNRYTPTSSAPTNETCCKDSAPEHKMFAKLMQDTLVVWAKHYGFDGFRFDLMGYIPQDVMKETLKVVREKSGNEHVYFLGEGWNPGSNATDSLGSTQTATQINLHGARIGMFNDRLRDAVRGNGPFDHGNQLLALQGFATGRCSDISPERLAKDPEYKCGKDVDNNKADDGMDSYTWQDNIRITMAGALRDYSFTTHKGVMTGEKINYWGAPAGYTDEPIESINYVSKHDNPIVFDMIMYKSNSDASTEGMNKKVRQQAIAVATVLLGQSPAFDAHGSDLLRSKSFENDSYNSGDWVNGIRYMDNEDNGYSLGYTNSSKDADDWTAVAYARKKNAAAGPELKAKMHDYYLELLNIRRDYKDYISLGTAKAIQEKVTFPDGGNDTDGVIVMQIKGDKTLTIVINASPKALDAAEKYKVEGSLIKTQADKAEKSIAADESTGTLSTPDAVQPWSVAVFEK